MQASTNPKSVRQGFTLVELLTVIVIIGILLSLLTGAVVRARNTVKRAAIKVDLNEFEMALEQYKNTYGEYPPDFTDSAAVTRHLRKAFPRYDHTEFTNDLSVYGIDAADLDPASALVFWLGGLPESVPAGSDQWIPAGFHSDPAHPFQPGGPRTKPFFTFVTDPDKERFEQEDSQGRPLRYYPNTSAGVQGCPYVYFRARRLANGRYEYGRLVDTDSDGTPDIVRPLRYTHATGQIAIPYVGSNPDDPDPLSETEAERMKINLAAGEEYLRRWRNPQTFQILAPGLDSEFGAGGEDSAGDPTLFRYTKRGGGFSADGADFDNIANFSEGILEDEIE
jgi:prepilin-type N-terminal cleavage/methylation domain-containing protein